MTHHDDVTVRIKFLMRSRRHIAHRHQLGSSNPRGLEFPRLADIEQREGFTCVHLSLHVFHTDFVFRHHLALLPCPLRRTLFHESLNTLCRIRSLHQVFEINFLGASQPFVEMHGIPGIRSFLGDGKSRRTELEQTIYALCDPRIEFCFWPSTRGQADLGSFFSGNRSPGKNQISRALLADQRSQSRACDGWIAAKFDLGESPLNVTRGMNEVANHRQLCAATEAGSMYQGNRHLLRGDKGPDHGMELDEHLLYFVRSMRGDINSRGECLPFPAQYNDG